MSKTQLQTNNTKLSQLLTELQGKAAGGGGSGGAIETCTVTIEQDFNLGPSFASLIRVIATVLNNGNIEVINRSLDEAQSATVENVISGSFIIIRFTNSAMYSYHNAELIGLLSGPDERAIRVTGTKDSQTIIGFA